MSFSELCYDGRFEVGLEDTINDMERELATCSRECLRLETKVEALQEQLAEMTDLYEETLQELR